jgi:hypothetical protein
MTMRSSSYSALLAVIALFASGCCVDRFSERSSGCHDGKCGVEETCSSCNDTGCGACRGPGPIQAFKEMIHGSGCGEFYYDEWINDPPYCCDPCDDHGSWVGPRCCPPKIPGLKGLFGQRGMGCSCHACLQRPSFAHDGEIIEGEVIYEGPVIDGAVETIESNQSATLRPTPARQVSTAKSVIRSQPRSHKVYYKRGSAGPR